MTTSMLERKTKIAEETEALLVGVTSEGDIKSRVQRHYGEKVNVTAAGFDCGIATVVFTHADVPDEMILVDVMLQRGPVIV